MDVAKNVKASFDDFDNELFIQGFTNVLDSTDILIDATIAQQVVRTYFQNKQKEDAIKSQEAAAENKEAGEKFLAENKTKEGVQTTASGLQYSVLKEGTGEKPTMITAVYESEELLSQAQVIAAEWWKMYGHHVYETIVFDGPVID